MASKAKEVKRFVQIINQQLEILKEESNTVKDGVDEFINRAQREVDSWVNGGHVNQTTCAEMSNQIQQNISFLIAKSAELSGQQTNESNENQASLRSPIASKIGKVQTDTKHCSEEAVDNSGCPKGSLGKNSKEKVNDANKPKFLAQCRKEAAKAGKAPTKIAEFTKESSEKWRSLTVDKKKPFEAAAADDKKRYEQEMEAYKGKTVDPNKPKIPPHPASFFLADFSIRMANKGIEQNELFKMAGEKWNALSNEDKKPYEKRALEESKKYESAMTDHRKTGGGASGGPPEKKAKLVVEEEEDEDDDEEEDDDDEDEDEEEDDDDEDDDE